MAVPVTIGTPTKGRVVAGASVILAGAALLVGLTLAGVPNYWLLFTLGAVATVAWLVDGSSTRYLGPGLLGLAAGSGIALGEAFEVSAMKAEHGLVYGLFGIALLALSYLNPRATRAGGAFLAYTALTVWGVTFSKGWWLAAILVAWGSYWLYRASTTDGLPQPALDERAARAQSRIPVGAGTR